MSKARIRYFEQEDVLHLVIADEPESRSIELSPNITVELNDKNEMIGVEIPTHLGDEESRLLRRLAAIRGEHVEDEQGLFGKIRSAFHA